MAEKEGSFWLPSQDTSHKKLITKQEHLVMATGIPADWFESSPQLCVCYYIAASGLYHSSEIRMESSGVPDLPVTERQPFLFGFACYAYMSLARPWGCATWEYF